MINTSKFLVIVEFLYQNILKPSVFVIFKLYYGRGKCLQPQRVNNPLYYKSASQLAQEIRSRRIKSETVVRLYIDRVKEIQPILNCVVDERFENAIKDAQEVDKSLESNNCVDDLPPLFGVPFTCSELIAVKGMKNSAGLFCRKNIDAEEDADVIQLLKRAGGILICTTNISELGLPNESSNHVYGKTFNPYDLRLTCGGSSGGEASIISACGSVIGIGSDMGGGIRLPANFTGIFAHKPTNGLISNYGNYAANVNESMLTMGPLCRYSHDLNLMLDLMMPDEHKNLLLQYDHLTNFKHIKFFYIDNIDAPFISKISNDTNYAIVKVVKFIETQIGVEVKRLQSRHLNKAYKMWYSLLTQNNNRSEIAKLMTDRKYEENSLNELFLSIIGKNEHTLPTIMMSFMEALTSNTEEKLNCLDLIKALKEELNSLLGINGVFIFPSFPNAPPYHNQTLWTNTFDELTYFGIFNVLGLPSTQVCLGLNRERLPIGVQLVTNCFCDKLTIRIANLIEEHFGGWIEP